MKKSEFCEIFSRNLWQKNQWKWPTMYFVFKREIIQIFMKSFIKFYQKWQILVKNSWKRWMKSTDFTLFSRKFKHRYLPVKNQNKKIFLVPYSTLDELSTDTSLNSLRWIYRSAKIDWTKKNPVEYIVPPPSRGVGTIIPLQILCCGKYGLDKKLIYTKLYQGDKKWLAAWLHRKSNSIWLKRLENFQKLFLAAKYFLIIADII